MTTFINTFVVQYICWSQLLSSCLVTTFVFLPLLSINQNIYVVLHCCYSSLILYFLFQEIMRLYTAVLFMAMLAIVIWDVSKGQQNKALMFNEIKVVGANRFLEMISPYPNLSLNGYYITIMGYDKDNSEKDLGWTLNVRAICSLNNLRLKGQLGWVGKEYFSCQEYFSLSSFHVDHLTFNIIS